MGVAGSWLVRESGVSHQAHSTGPNSMNETQNIYLGKIILVIWGYIQNVRYRESKDILESLLEHFSSILQI